MNMSSVLIVVLCTALSLYEFQCAAAECVVTNGQQVCKKTPRKSYYAMRSSSIAPQKLTKAANVGYEVCAQVCSFWSCTTYYCPGDGICCTPGSPTSLCCPADHPLCLSTGCCATGHPKICGLYCCQSDSVCCNEENCCLTEDQCCGPDQCCLEQTPCCTGDSGKTCCDKDTMACCDSEGCVLPCPCQFDAIGCQPQLRVDDVLEVNIAKGPNVDCPNPYQTKTLYRILRPDENCATGLIAKDPTVNKKVISHVNCGSRSGYKSQFVSFSSSLEIANYYREKFGPKLQIATVDISLLPTTCNIIDLTNEQNRQLYLGKAVCSNFAKASCEVLLACGSTPIPCTIGDNTGKYGNNLEL